MFVSNLPTVPILSHASLLGHEAAKAFIPKLSSVLSPAANALPSWLHVRPNHAVSSGIFADLPERLTEAPKDIESALPHLDPSRYLGFSELFSVAGDVCGGLAAVGVVILGGAIALGVVGSALKLYEGHMERKEFCAKTIERFQQQDVGMALLADTMRQRYDVGAGKQPDAYQLVQEKRMADAVYSIIKIEGEISSLPPETVAMVTEKLAALQTAKAALDGKLRSQAWVGAKAPSFPLDGAPAEPDHDGNEAWLKWRDEIIQKSYDGGLLFSVLQLQENYVNFVTTVKAFQKLRETP